MVTQKQMQDAAATILKGARGQPGPALTERELLQLVVNFANGGKLAGPLLHAPGVRFLVPLERSQDGQRWVAGTLDHDPTAADVAPTEHLAQLRAQLTQDLASAIGKGLPQKDLDRLKSAASQMVATPAYEIQQQRQGRSYAQRRHLHVRWHYVPLSLEATLALAVLWLRDDDLKLGADLKRCKLETCGRFFFSSARAEQTGKQAGRPPELYCDNAHMIEAHKATAAERTRRWREKKMSKVAGAAKHK